MFCQHVFAVDLENEVEQVDLDLFIAVDRQLVIAAGGGELVLGVFTAFRVAHVDFFVPAAHDHLYG
ncbi:hypothetical protein D3C77_794780 [compost metagenome]